MSEYKDKVIRELTELNSYYKVISDFIEKFNDINYIKFDHHVVHDFTLFLVDPDFNFDKLDNEIKRINKTLPPIKRIFSKPVLHLTEKDEILPIEAVTKINSHTINHIARHSELWDDVNEKGIKPLKLLTRTYFDNYGIYENLVFCKTIDDILIFVRRNIRLLKNFNYVNQSLKFDLLEKTNHLNYFLALGKLHTGYIRNFDKYYVVLKNSLSDLENIYNIISSRLKKPVYAKNKARPKKLKKTNILAMHRDYKHIYSLEKHFVKDNQEFIYEFDKNDYKVLKQNYVSYCILLSIFAVGHFNFKCDEDMLINYEKLDINFEYKNWKLNIKNHHIKNIRFIEFKIVKDIEYKIALIPIVLLELKDESIDNVKEIYDADEYITCFPYELDDYKHNECCIDITNIESFRRIQQILLRAMIYSDKTRDDCPFCDGSLNPTIKEDKAYYECEGCRTRIFDVVCSKTNSKYTYTDIKGYERPNLDISDYKLEEWLYYRKKEALLHFRNITKLDNELSFVCPKCGKIHDE